MKPKELTADAVWREYEKMLAYNDSIQLDDTVRVNENFFIGKQWEGVESNGLPTPQFNFLKRVTLFTVASITSHVERPSLGAITIQDYSAGTSLRRKVSKVISAGTPMRAGNMVSPRPSFT